jgi:hypothetical protein
MTSLAIQKQFFRFVPQKEIWLQIVPYSKMEKIISLVKKNRKAIVICTSITILQLIWGFDPKFCIINIIWLLV